MQYNDTSTLQGILQEAYFMIGNGSGTAPVDYSANDQKRNANNWYRRAVSGVLNSIGGWLFSDSTATTSLVSGTRTYDMTAAGFANLAISKILQVTRVEVSYDNGTTWYEAKPLDQGAINGSINSSTADADLELNDTTQPHYILHGSSIDLYPKPTQNSTSGLKLYFTTDITDLSGNTDVPTIPTLFHRYISLGVAYDYCMSRNLPNAQILRQEIELYMNEMKNFISDRNQDEAIIAAPFPKYFT